MYSAEMVEGLLPRLWDRSAPNPNVGEAPDVDMPRSPTDPRRLNDEWAVMADIQRAHRRCHLDLAEKQALFCIYGLGESAKGAATLLGADYYDVAHARDRALHKIVDFLNGFSAST